MVKEQKTGEENENVVNLEIRYRQIGRQTDRYMYVYKCPSITESKMYKDLKVNCFLKNITV